VKGVNVPGYHFHFITEDRSAGGHLLECRMPDIEAEIDETSEFYMVLSQGEEFLKIDLTKEKEAELERVEK
jgi:acetolactate decarboxylase